MNQCAHTEVFLCVAERGHGMLGGIFGGVKGERKVLSVCNPCQKDCPGHEGHAFHGSGRCGTLIEGKAGGSDQGAWLQPVKGGLPATNIEARSPTTRANPNEPPSHCAHQTLIPLRVPRVRPPPPPGASRARRTHHSTPLFIRLMHTNPL